MPEILTIAFMVSKRGALTITAQHDLCHSCTMEAYNCGTEDNSGDKNLKAFDILVSVDYSLQLLPFISDIYSIGRFNCGIEFALQNPASGQTDQCV